MRDIENNIDTQIPKSGNINIFNSSDTCEFCGAIVRAEFREGNFNASAIENGITTKLISEWGNYKTRVLEDGKIERE